MNNTEWTFIYLNNWWKCFILQYNFRNIQITKQTVVVMGTLCMCLTVLLEDSITQNWVRILIAGKPAAFSLQWALVLDYITSIYSVKDDVQDHPQSINVLTIHGNKSNHSGPKLNLEGLSVLASQQNWLILFRAEMMLRNRKVYSERGALGY